MVQVRKIEGPLMGCMEHIPRIIALFKDDIWENPTHVFKDSLLTHAVSKL